MKISLTTPDGQSIGKSEIEDALASIGWKTNDHYVVIVMQSNSTDYADSRTNTAENALEEHFRDSIRLDMEGALALVVRYADNQESLSGAWEGYRGILESEGLHCGVSTVFNEASLFWEYCNLAKLALDIGMRIEPEQAIHRYESIMLFHVVNLCSQALDIRLLCSEQILRIYEHDQKHGSDLIQTLYVYLLENKSLIRASERLHVHRNTMVYRLAKINEIADLDMNDGKMRQNLLFSCTVLQYVDAMNKD